MIDSIKAPDLKNRGFIDMHAHIYPDKIAQKAVEAIGQFYDIPMRCSGTLEELLELGEKAGIDKFLVHSTATRPEQVSGINNYIIGTVQDNNRLIGFGTLHPGYDDIGTEVGRMKAAGLKGIKLHPDFQHFNIDDPEAFKIYKKCSGIFPILFHTGDNRYEYSSPQKLAKVLDIFPDLIVIAAHFGGYSRWEDSLKYLAGRKNLYFDTSSSLEFIEKDLALKIIEKHGADNIFFGTDYPMWDPASEIAKIMALGLPEDACNKILFENAERFLQGLG